LLERIKNEGANSPADIFLTVDAARLAKAHELNLFAPLASKPWKAASPPICARKTGFLSTRARVIVYNKTQVKAEDVQNYADLANPS
jgi:iron(III) transport system substrate-binding protein